MGCAVAFADERLFIKVMINQLDILPQLLFLLIPVVK